ncbi:ABC transporter substrate-binding protein [Dysosmobacter sp.]|uniref:ABC transporter substrate-binding protein n=1 Tax=Dysosmobacter sp. TaxID=2591382 RepID=UPI003FD874D1
MKKRVICAILSWILCMTFALTACGGSSNDGEGGPAAQGRDSIAIAISSDSSDLNPHGIYGMYYARIKSQVYEPLIYRTADNKLEPCLATEWTWQDDTTLILKIREGVKFHNGETLTAQDALFSLQKVAESSETMAVDKLDLANSSVDGDYTLILKLKEPDAATTANLAHCTTGIFSQKGYEAANGEFTLDSIGTGPYKWDEWVSGSYQTLVANEDYWGGAPAIKKVELRVITEAANRVIALETGEADFAYDVSASDIPLVRENENLDLLMFNTNDITGLGFNMTKGVFSDNKNLRYAMIAAFDRKSAIALSYVDATAPDTIFDPSTPGTVEGSFPKYDLEAAKEYLAAAGYPNGGLSVRVHTGSNEARIKIAELFQADLAKIGVNLEIVSLDNAANINAIAVERNFDMFMWGVAPVTGDLSYALKHFWSKSPSSLNKSGYSNPDYDALLEEGMEMLDESRRFDLYAQAQAMLYDDCPWIPFYAYQNVYAKSTTLHGFVEGSFHSPLWKTWTLS